MNHFVSPLPADDFRTLFESAPGLYLVLKPDLTIVAVSDAYLRATKTRREEIVGAPVFDVFPDNPDDPAATGVKNVRASLERVLLQKTADALAVQKYDIRRPDSEGGGFEERYWSPVNSPVFDEAGQVVYIIHRVEDVTDFIRLKQIGSEERKLTLQLRTRAEQMESEIFFRAQELQDTNRLLREAQNELEARVHERTLELENAMEELQSEFAERLRAEGALKESEQGYRLLFKTNPHPMWVYDVKTLAFLAVNDAAIDHYGYSANEFLSMTIMDIRPSDQVPLVQEAVRALSRDSTTNVSVKHRKKDGRLIDVEVTSQALTFRGASARLVLATDMTERCRLEEQLRQSQKMKAIGSLAGGIAHDFNNLLTAIIGYSQMLSRRFEHDDDARSDIEEIEKAGHRAASLTNQLLAFSRKQVLEPKIVCLNFVLDEIEKFFRRLLGEDIDLVTILRPELGVVKADPGQLQQVILNLVVNARDAMPTGGKLTIETSNVEIDDAYVRTHVDVTPGSYVMLAVSDNGCGMDSKTQDRIFEPFFTTKEQGKGTGLGLSTVYGIVKQSGGHIWVYSEPGHGTTFKIYLPRAEQAETAARVNGYSNARTRGTETVLLVEDEPLVRQLAVRVLQERGYTVLQAVNGEESLRLAEAYDDQIHLLLTDVVMPGISGSALAARIKEQRSITKVLFASGYTDDAIVHHGMLDPGVAFLQKPFTPDSLARKVREVLDAPMQ